MSSSARRSVIFAAALLIVPAGCGSRARGPGGAAAEGDAALPPADEQGPPVDAAAPRDSAPVVVPEDGPTSTPDVAAGEAQAASRPDVPPSAGHCPAGLERPTAAEIKSVSERLKSDPYVPQGTNQGNNLAYGNTAKMAVQLRTTFALTGDVYFLDRMIVFADHMLSVRNDRSPAPRTIWTGAVEPCWPNKAPTDPDAAYCGTENGLVLDYIAAVAGAIFANRMLWNQNVGVPDPYHFGTTYLARARTYLTEVEHTLDTFLVPRYLQPAKEGRLYMPTDAGYAALGPSYVRNQGNAVPWNQQDMITGALSTVADALMSLGEEPARVMKNDQITRAAIDWFVSELAANQYTAKGVPVYKWGYTPGDVRHIENLAHASADINMLYKAYKHGRFGVTTMTMVPMANTFLDVIAQPGGTYAANVDGTGTRAEVSDAWLNYEEFRPGIVAALHPNLTTVDTSTNIATAIAMLGLRQKLCE
jgi:hypothetical protein